jgi:hypothetical protein
MEIKFDDDLGIKKPSVKYTGVTGWLLKIGVISRPQQSVYVMLFLLFVVFVVLFVVLNNSRNIANELGNYEEVKQQYPFI